MTLRLVLVEDHAIVRAGLRQLFALVSDLDVIGEASSGAQLLALLRRHRPDLVLMDLAMPGIAGTDLVTRVRSQYPQLPLLVLSMHKEPQIAKRALRAGASGYVTKDSDPEVLIAAVRKVGGGGRFIDPQLAEQMAFDALVPVEERPHERLTGREFQILGLLVRGTSLNAVAEQLAISSKTVSTHKARLMQKMDLHSNADLVRYGLLHGLSD